jgi:hypothetical protein
MAAKTANNILLKKDVEVLHAFPVDSGEVIYQDTLVGIDADGLLKNIASANVATLRIVGVVADDSNVKPPAATGADGSLLGGRTSADNGNKTVRQVWLRGRFLLSFTDTLAQTDCGKLAYAKNNNDCSVSPASAVLIGTIVEIHSTSQAWVELNVIMPSYPDQEVAVVKGALAAPTTNAAGGIFNVANPFAADAQVESVIVKIATASTGAATMDVGIGTTLTDDKLLDGVTLNGSVTGLKTIGTDGGTNGKAFRPIIATEKVLATASASAAGLVGTYSIVFRKF